MPSFVHINGRGLIALDQVVAVGGARSAAMRRLIAVTPPTHLVDLTGGRKRESVLVLESGHVMLTALPLATIQQRFAEAGESHEA